MKKIFILFFWLLLPGVCGAETWELAIQPWDKPDLSSGHKRAKTGDVVAVKPYPWAWGAAELQNYLIVIVDNLTEEEAMQLMSPLYEGDDAGSLDSPGTITGKRKFRLDLDKLKTDILPDLDTAKVTNQAKSEPYQPFKNTKTKIAIDTLDGDVMQNKYDKTWRKGKKQK